MSTSKQVATMGYDMFIMPYYIQNNGDGSCGIRLCETIQEAADADENQDEAYGDSTADELEFYVKDNII